jgi:Tfp pilus assembly protein PilF
MSVIIDALKANQRERARRESRSSTPETAPVLISLRSKPHAGDGRQRMLLLAGVGAIAIGGAALGAWQLQKKPALPAVPPVTSSILSEALADSARDTKVQANVGEVPRRDGNRVDSARTAQAAPRIPATVPRVAVAPPARDTLAVPQGEPRAVAAAGGDTARAPRRLRVAVDRASQPLVAELFAEAVAAQRAGDVANARRLYDSVLVLAPNDADALNNEGVLLLSQRELGRSMELLRRAASIAPRKADIWNNIGTVYREQGKRDDAVGAFRQALALDPQHPGAKIGLAQEYIVISSFAQARVLLEEVVSAHPQLSEAQYTLGQLLERMQDRAGAIVAYEAFIRSAPPRLATYVDLVKRRVEMLSR